MPRYDDLEHDSHEEPEADAPPASPPGLSSPTNAGEEPVPKNPLSRFRRTLKAKQDRDAEWLRIDNDAIWEGDPYGD